MSANASTTLGSAISPSDGREPLFGAVFDELLRNRAKLYARLESRDGIADLARALIIIVAGSAAIFGASVGAYRGGIQIAFAAIKLPLILLLTTAVCAPTWSALRAAVGAPSSITHDLLRVLIGIAMVGLVLAALAPFMLVGVVVNASYHTMALTLVCCAAIAGSAGIGVLVASGRGDARWFPLILFVALFVMVGAQMSWTLRPYLVRPRAESTEFVRSIEGSFIEAAANSWSSANGRFDREYAPLPGEDEAPAIESEADGDGDDSREGDDSWR